MRTIKFQHPDYPNHKNFVKAIDLANVSSISPNGDVWNIRMENGEHIRMMVEGEGTFSHFVDECQAAKMKRDTADAIKRRR